MNRKQCKLATASLVIVALCGAPALADVNVTVDPGLNWVGYMNVFDLPIGSGGFLWGSGWGTPDLPATFNGNQLRLAPNTNTWDPADPYWVDGNGDGAKWTNANMYVEDSTLIGETVHFTGHVVENSLEAPFQSQAFIKVLDPGAGWAVVAEAYAPLVTGQDFQVSLAIDNVAGLVPQYGFVTDSAPVDPAGDFGQVLINYIPEPSSLLLFAGLAGAALYRRR